MDQYTVVSIMLSPQNRARKILDQFRIAESNAVQTIRDCEDVKHCRQDGILAGIRYRKAIGFLMYLTTYNDLH